MFPPLRTDAIFPVAETPGTPVSPKLRAGHEPYTVARTPGVTKPRVSTLNASLSDLDSASTHRTRRRHVRLHRSRGPCSHARALLRHTREPRLIRKLRGASPRHLSHAHVLLPITTHHPRAGPYLGGPGVCDPTPALLAPRPPECVPLHPPLLIPPVASTCGCALQSARVRPAAGITADA